MYKKGNKILASLIVFIMLLANVSTTAFQLGGIIAADFELNTQNSKTNHANVEFDSYFIDGEKAVHDVTKNIGEDNKIVAKISVKEAGYLKDARVEFVDSNYTVSDQTDSDKVAKIENNAITLNQINASEDTVIELPFIFKHGTTVNLNQFDKTSSVKFTAIYVDNNGKENNIKKEIKLGLKWTANVEEELTAEITKYIPYNINEKKGIIMQMLVSKDVKENKLPIKESNIEILVPQINGVNPKDVTVFSDETMEFTFDKQNNKLVINTKNDANENNEITWSENSKKDYVVTYTYPETAISENETAISIKAKSDTIVYSYNNQSLTSEYEQEVTLKEKVGDIVDFTVNTADTLSKGYAYANYNREEKLETPYTQKVTANISMVDLVDELTFNMTKDIFTVGEKTFEANSYYKTLRIAKAEFNKFFGEDGFVKIYKGEENIATIDKTVEDENIIVELNADEISVETSKPVVEGKLVFELDKAIKGDTIYEKSQFEHFENLSTKTILIAKNSDTVIVEKQVDTTTGLVEPLAQTELVINNKDLSTVVTNENVELRAILKTNSEYNKLFVNPTIVINIPNYIKNINVKNVQLMFDDELTIKDWKLEGNQIIVELEGAQTNYSIGSSYGGTNIVITADLTANNLTPNTTDKVTMTTTSNGEEIVSKLDINFIAPSGLVAVNTISNFAEGQEIMALTEDESATLEVEAPSRTATEEIQIINNYNNPIENVSILGRTLTEGTTNTETGENLNNTLNTRMTSAISTEADATIYYSANGNATNDLNNNENGWRADVNEVDTVRSYLILMNNEAMNTGDTATFTYDMEIPENLSYSQTATSLYSVNFDNVQEEQTMPDRVMSRMATLSTGIAPELEVTLNSSAPQNSVVRNGQYITFTATVRNTSSVDAQNTKLKVTAPSETTYAIERVNDDGITIVELTTDASQVTDPENSIVCEYKTKHTEYKEENFFTGYDDIEGEERIIDIGTIKAGEQVKVEYILKIENVLEAETASFTDNDGHSHTDGQEKDLILTTTARAIADDMQKEVSSNEYKLQLKEAELGLLVSRDKTTDSVLIKGDEITYTAKVSQISNHDSINNVVVTMQIPQGLTIKSANVENIVDSESQITSNYNIDNNNNTVQFTINKMDVGNELNCNVVTEVGNALGEISAVATATANGIQYNGNILKNVVSKVDFEITQSRIDNPYVKELNEITFEYVVKNTSEVYAQDFTLENIIPDAMEAVSIETVVEDDSIVLKPDIEDGKIIETRTFKPGQTIKFRITMKAKLLPDGQTTKTFENYATIYGQGFDTKTSNKVNVTIEYNEDAHRTVDPNNPDNPYNPTVKKIISGIAWLDKNNDGERNDDEELIAGMEVRLLNKENNEVIKTTTTSSSGEYTFTELEKGEYLVVFLYNSAKYDLTEYKKSGISQSTNSDVIDVTMNIDGTDRTVAISDTIRIKKSNARNIDIGLIESNKSDLKLDKYISSITLTYGNTVKTYDYENAKLAKVEIPAKELSNATVIVNYKIVVTNEGAIGNYVKKIVDYVPSGMKFNSELNRDWYQSTNGDLYNSSLANVKLESGESKEVTLTLTKQMTDSNTGIVNNNAELYEVYNEEGIKDIDSTPANKISGEDDMSAADVVISVKTGDAVIYTLIISTVILAIIGVAVFYIRKHLLRKM